MFGGRGLCLSFQFSLAEMTRLLLIPIRDVEYYDGHVCASVCVCVSVCVYVREHISKMAGPIFTKFLCMSPGALARSSLAA